MHLDIIYTYIYIAKITHLEKPKRLIIWDEGVKKKLASPNNLSRKKNLVSHMFFTFELVTSSLWSCWWSHRSHRSTAHSTTACVPALNHSLATLFVALDEKNQTYAYTQCSSRLVLFLLEEQFHTACSSSSIYPKF